MRSSLLCRSRKRQCCDGHEGELRLVRLRLDAMSSFSCVYPKFKFKKELIVGILDRLFGGHHRDGDRHHGGVGHHSANYRQGSSSVGASPSTACSKCHTANASGARFCKQCGNSLIPAMCGQCGAAVPTNAKFCEQCGKPIA